MILFLEAQGTNAYNRYTMCPAGQFNKGRSSKFRGGSRVRQTPEEGRRTYRPKRCGNNNKDEDNSPKNFNDKNQQASSQKFRQSKNFVLLYCHLLFHAEIYIYVLDTY